MMIKNEAYNVMERGTERRAGNSEAFLRLVSLCRPIEGLDETRELVSWREEKFRQ